MGDQLPAGARDVSEEEYVSGLNFLGDREQVVSRRYDARTQVPQAARVLAAALALVGFALGAVSVGRDWLAGVMAGLLVWHPRRVRALLARLGVLAGSLVVSAIGAFVLVWVGGLLDGALRGTTHGLTTPWWTDQAWFAARSGVVGVLCLAVGAAMADLVRSASLPLGVMLGIVVVNPVAGTLVPVVRPWPPVSLIRTVLAWGQRFRAFDGRRVVRTVWVPGGAALAVLVLLTAVLVGMAAVARVRRDAV